MGVRDTAGSGSSEGSFPGCRQLTPPMGRGGGEFSEVPYIRNTDPTYKGLSWRDGVTDSVLPHLEPPHPHWDLLYLPSTCNAHYTASALSSGPRQHSTCSPCSIHNPASHSASIQMASSRVHTAHAAHLCTRKTSKGNFFRLMTYMVLCSFLFVLLFCFVCL